MQTVSQGQFSKTIFRLSDDLLNVTVFRAYDVRGVYGTELTEDIAREVGKALGSYLPDGRIALGRDTRTSGPSMERAFLEGVLSTRRPQDLCRRLQRPHQSPNIELLIRLRVTQLASYQGFKCA